MNNKFSKGTKVKVIRGQGKGEIGYVHTFRRYSRNVMGNNRLVPKANHLPDSDNDVIIYSLEFRRKKKGMIVKKIGGFYAENDLEAGVPNSIDFIMSN